MSDPNAPWAYLHLTDEQDRLVKRHVQLQMLLVGKIKKSLLHLALAVFFLWIGQAYTSYVSTVAGPSDLPGIEFMSEVIFKWGSGCVALMSVGMIALTMNVMNKAQHKLAELPLEPHQVQKVREITTWAIELALLGRTGFKLLGQVRARLGLS